VSTESHIKRIINHLETLLDGCFLLGELSNRTSDTILSFEKLSSYIIAEALKQNFKNSSYKDSELIKTNSNFGKATVNQVNQSTNY
jgi:aspartokinase/homoserine dehydrogenase 1